MRAVLLTGGDPGALTGGSRYHREVAARGSANGCVELGVRSLDAAEDVRTAAASADVVIVDSLVAARVRPAELATPVVASVHQLPGGLSGPLPGRIRRGWADLRCYRDADAVVVPSALLAAALARGGVRRERIHLVAPGRDLPAAAPAEPRRPGVAFVSVANVARHKRIPDLLDAFARLTDLEATLTVVGAAADVREARVLRERLRGPGLGARATWVGPLSPPSVAAALGAADVFVLPALYESYGIAVAEAMSAGVPSIVARSGNLPELVHDGVDGLVVPPRDVGALARAMRVLATDDALRGSMGAMAARRAAQLPTWDETAARFWRVVVSVAQRDTGRTSAA